jgi:hypothetical protein
MKGDIPYHPIERDEHYSYALKVAEDKFRPPNKCRPVHIFDIRHHYPLNRSTNAEAPFSTNPTFRKMLPPNTPTRTGEMLNIITDYTRQWHHEIKDGTANFDKYMFPMLLHLKPTVFHIDKPNKIRAVWGVPKPWIWAQIMFHWTLFAAYRRNPKSYPLLWGYETATGGHLRLNAELFHSYRRASYMMLDWSQFDKAVPHEGADDIMDITETYIDFDHGYIPTQDYPDTESTWTPLKAQRLRRLYAWTKYSYRHSKLALPDGTLLTRKFATLPSGLYTTQYFDSFWNVIMITTIMSELGFDKSRYFLKVLGDDSLIALSLMIPANQHADFLLQFAEVAQRRFGATLSPEKSSMSNNINKVEVLSYTNHSGLPYRTNVSLLARLYHTTTRNPTPSKSMATAIGIAQASYGMHHDVYYVCKDIYDHYASQGFTPDEKHYNKRQMTDPENRLPLPQSFPSLLDLTKGLFSTAYVNLDSYNRFYDRTHFLSDY